MTNIKKLFLTLSLLAMQSAFCMDPVTKKARTDAEEWTLVAQNSDFAPFANSIIVVQELSSLTNPHTYFIIPTVFGHDSDDYHYILYACKRGSNPQTFNCSYPNNLLATHPLKVRCLLFEEARDLYNGIESNDILVNHAVILRDGRDDRSVLPKESKDLFPLSCLTRKAQDRYIIHNYLKFPKTLLGVRRFRQSALNQLQNDVVRLICKIGIADARAKNPVLKFEE